MFESNGVIVVNVLIIGYLHDKYDKRVFRTVNALSKRAKVMYQYFSKQPAKPYYEGNVHYYPLTKSSERNPLKKIKSRVDFDRSIVKLIKTAEYDILYMHAFPFSMPLAAFKWAKKRNKVVVYDLHELHPEDMFENLPAPLRYLKRFIFWNVFRKQIELCDKIICVSQDTETTIFEKIGLRKPSLVVPNYASLKLSSPSKNKEICIVGKTPRGLSQAHIKLLSRLNEAGFLIKVIGYTPNFPDDLKYISLEALPYERMMEEISKSAFSFISYDPPSGKSSKNYMFALPNKFFDSISAGTPVIVRDSFVTMSKLVKELGIGVVIEPEDVDKSVEDILRAYENYEILFENVVKYQDMFVWDEVKEKEFVEFVIG
ncbi:Glycosyltransferase involved in cell wall bisynthesis [Fervidobacterium changbaicum]|nr:Glycosyltransferase involved in cell wall bisynthesis [Fervidobacterium changbaicum]